MADQEKTRKASSSSRHPPPAATVTSGHVSPRASTGSGATGHVSPARGNSPKAGCSYSTQPSDSPKPGSSRGSSSSLRSADHGLGAGFHLRETASYLNGLPPDLFGCSGIDDWGEDEVLRQVLAASQQEYLDSLKKNEDSAHAQESDKKRKEEQE